VEVENNNNNNVEQNMKGERNGTESPISVADNKMNYDYYKKEQEKE
jgi:hypothetical protein